MRSQLLWYSAARIAEMSLRVRLGNKKFLRTAGKFAAALRLLEAVGFERESSAEGDVYALKRTDPGLLWLGRSALADLVAP